MYHCLKTQKRVLEAYSFLESEKMLSRALLSAYIYQSY